MPQLTLPVTVDANSSFVYKGTDYGSVALPVEPEDQHVIDEFLGYAFPGDTMHAKPLPKPSTVTVTVQNSTRTANQATTTAAALTQLGYRATPAADLPSSGTVSETIVAYTNPTDRAAAETVARSLAGVVILAHQPTIDGATVTVITGTDYTVNPPQVNTTTTRPQTRTTTPATTTTSINPALTSSPLTPPTQSLDHLAEFDPRSCTPTGGPGT